MLWRFYARVVVLCPQLMHIYIVNLLLLHSETLINSRATQPTTQTTH